MLYQLWMRLLVALGFVPCEARDRESHTDEAIARFEQEIEERNAVIEATTAAANDAGRDLTDNERELCTEAGKRIESLEDQLKFLSENRGRMASARKRQKEVSSALAKMRQEVDHGEIEYRSAGAYMLDLYNAHLNDRDAAQRLELFNRAADHQKTPDNLGIIPDPIIGDVVNFRDTARPLTSFFGAQMLPAATWHRPHVTQHTTVDVQGAAGAAADEKAELVSQKMIIQRITANAVTYGGYVNVSRQNVDFSTPSAFDAVTRDLAGSYAIQTEAAAAAELEATGTTAVLYGANPTADDVNAAVWEAVGVVYAATQGVGRVGLAIAPDVLGLFGPLVAPITQGGEIGNVNGFQAGNFGQGLVGSIGTVPVLMSAGLTAGTAFLFSTAAMEVYEQIGGQLQVVEPSVLGVQVAYYGYYTPLTIDDAGIVPLVASD